MYTEKNFFKSQELFTEWRTNKYGNSVCLTQSFDLKNGVLYEKWTSFKEDGEGIIYMAKIYVGGGGFRIFDLRTDINKY